MQEAPRTDLGSIEEGKAGAHTGDTCVLSNLFMSGGETECEHTPIPAQGSAPRGTRLQVFVGGCWTILDQKQHVEIAKSFRKLGLVNTGDQIFSLPHW